MFIDEWFGKNYYQQLGVGYHTQLSFGQVFWTHAYYPHLNLELWRPSPTPGEPTKTFAKDFQIRSGSPDAFARSIPLHAPKLETNEEFLVIRAKRRPVVLLQPENTLSNEDNVGFRGKVNRRLCLVAQVFGLADVKTGREEFSPAFVDRVRRMEFPELMFLPKCPGFLEVDSMLRLDGVQSVFVPHLEATSLALSAEVRDVLKQQFQLVLTGESPDGYTDLRELLLQDS